MLKLVLSAGIETKKAVSTLPVTPAML